MLVCRHAGVFRLQPPLKGRRISSGEAVKMSGEGLRSLLSLVLLVILPVRQDRRRKCRHVSTARVRDMRIGREKLERPQVAQRLTSYVSICFSYLSSAFQHLRRSHTDTMLLCFACRTHVPLLSLSDGVPRGRHVHRGRLRTHHQQSHHLQQTLHKPERAPRQRFLVLRLFTR